MSSEIKVRLLQPWRNFLKGAIISTNGGVADLLVNRKRPPIAEYVAPAATGVATLIPPLPGLKQIVDQVRGSRKGKERG